MTIEKAITQLKMDRDLCNFNPFTGEEEPMNTNCKKSAEALDMAVRALEMQNELAEYSGMDICQFIEDYDYEETDISEYEYEDSVDNFLIDEIKEGKER